MKIAERLIMAADYSPKDYGGRLGVEKKVLALAKELEGTGVYIKVNSILRTAGYDLIKKLHDLGLNVFADLKLIDIPSTMKTDAELLSFYEPEMLTVMCCSGIEGMKIVQEVLPDTKVLGVTVLTSLDEEKCYDIFSCLPNTGVLKFAKMADLAELYGLILSSKEVSIVRNDSNLNFLELITPGIRPEWSLVEGDDQSRVMTPAQAIKNGAQRIVIGRPIIQAENPRDAVKRTLEEIQQGFDERKLNS